MNGILLFFVLPVSTIILGIVLQKVLKSPTLVSATFFAIYLITAFTVFDSDFLIFAIAYTIIAYVAAVLAKIIKKLLNQINRWQMENDVDNNEENNTRANITTLTTNQPNPVLYLTNKDNRMAGRCWCCRRR